MNSRHITDLLINFYNKNIDKKQFNTNILKDIAFNFFYFKKKTKKIIKYKENQNKILQGYIKKESDLKKEEKRIINELRKKKKKCRGNQSCYGSKKN